MQKIWNKKQRALLLSLVTLFAFECLGLLSYWKHLSQDLVFALFDKPADSSIVLVEIDAASIRAIDQWPWSRSVHADLLNFLKDAGAEQVFFDIDFSRASNDAVADQALAEALQNNQDTKVILPSFWQSLSAESSDAYVLTEPLPAFLPPGGLVTVGMVNVGIADDGLAREIVHLDSSPRGVRQSVAAALAAAEELIPDRAYPIDFAIAQDQIERFSYHTVLEGDISSERFAGKTVFVGSTALELGDFLPVPVHGFIPGVALQALSYQTLKAGMIKFAPAWMSWAPLLLVVALWPTLRRLSWKHYTALFLTVSAASFALLAALYIYSQLLINIVPALIMGLLLGSYELFIRFDSQALELLRERLRRNRQGALIETLFNANSDSIIVVNEEQKIRSANETAHLLLSIPKDIEGLSLHDYLNLPGKNLQAAAQRSAKGNRPELKVETPLGEKTLEVSVTRSTVEDDSFYTLIARDISRAKSLRDELEYRANHDALTNLLNRAALNELLDRVHIQKHCALLLIDLDRFKQLNDSLGHSEGDNVLIELAERFHEFSHNKNFKVARVGGDEFALYINDFEHVDTLKSIGQSLIKTINKPFQVSGMSIELDASIGIAIYPDHAQDGPTLLKHADIAMYSAKTARTQIEVFDETKNHDGLRSMRIATAMRRAIREDALELFYQPKTYISSGMLSGAEALLRWSDDELGFISPGEFVPLAEDTGLIEPLTLWTIRKALADINSWHQQGIHIPVAINLSARHLSSNEFLDLITEEIIQANLPPGALELEITETELMSDFESGREFSARMHELGVGMAIDDYGTGFSSLSYLKSLNLDTLKIDRCFVTDIHTGMDNRHIVSATITMAHNLGMKVVAEGVECVEELDILKSLDCDIVQGYLISKPLPASEITRFVDMNYRQAEGFTKAS